MPNITLPNGRRHYVNPFQRFCDMCERDASSDYIVSRDRYECSDCQRDWDSEHHVGEYAEANDNDAHVASPAHDAAE